jgi:precorrin isomerase
MTQVEDPRNDRRDEPTAVEIIEIVEVEENGEIVELVVDDEIIELPQTIEITINGTAYSTTRREMTGEEIKALGNVPSAETLFLKLHESSEERIGDDHIVELHNHMAFESSPDGGVS